MGGTGARRGARSRFCTGAAAARSPLAHRRAQATGDRRMIPALNIVAWGNVVPWADQRQIEQDLIISRAIVEIFSDPLLGEALRFRGGTALNKLHFAAPLRYS